MGAMEYCKSQGNRLCKAQEISIARGTGCGHDNMEVWVQAEASPFVTPAGFECNEAKTLCIKHMSPESYHTAIGKCNELGARICLHTDFTELCGETSMDPFNGRSS